MVLLDTAILTMTDQQKVAYGLSNCAIFDDLEWLLTQTPTSRHSFMLNILETAKDMSIVAIKCT